MLYINISTPTRHGYACDPRLERSNYIEAPESVSAQRPRANMPTSFYCWIDYH